MKPGRVGCLNPRCGRTFKVEYDDEIHVCRECWKLLPAPVRLRYKQLKKRARLINRLSAKGNGFRRHGRKFGHPDKGDPQALTMVNQFNKLWRRHWDWITAFYLNPEKPEGLDTFLEELFGES